VFTKGEPDVEQNEIIGWRCYRRIVFADKLRVCRTHKNGKAQTQANQSDRETSRSSCTCSALSPQWL